MSDFARTVRWGIAGLSRSSIVLVLFLLSFLEFLVKTPFSLSSKSLAIIFDLNVMVLVYIATGRMTSLFERKQIEPFLNFPGRIWKLYPALFTPYLIVGIILSLSLLASIPTLLNVKLSMLVIIYSLFFLFSAFSISILLKNSTVNMMIISSLYLVPPLLLLNAASYNGRVPTYVIAAGSVSPLSAIDLFNTSYQPEILQFSLIYLLVSFIILLLSLVSTKVMDLI
ncbi:MAG: hypothetical protein ACYDAZ_08600 [Thermoplasmataceae archaeon]